MSKRPAIFDAPALARHRARAQRIGFADFLHREALFEIEERLMDVNRRFTEPAIVTPFAEFWAQLRPDAKILRPAETLPLEPESHDLVVHAMHLHWCEDPVGQLIQCRRALKPDGLFLAASFGGGTLSELRAALAEAESQLTGGLSPRMAPMAEIRDLGSLLQRAGFALPVSDALRKTVVYEEFTSFLHDLRAMGETNALKDRQKSFAKRDLFARAQRIYQQSFADAQGRLPASFEIIFLTGWAPSETQQKPLRPGSAAARLADALRIDELGPDGKPVTGDGGKRK